MHPIGLNVLIRILLFLLNSQTISKGYFMEAVIMDSIELLFITPQFSVLQLVTY